MKHKIEIAIFLSLVMVLALSLSVTAADNDLVGESDTREVNCVNNQIERLRDLLHGRVVVPFDAENVPANIPRVTILIPPEGPRQYFLIGVEVEPTQECVDFILYYTGIPRELAYIGIGYAKRQILPLDSEEYGHNKSTSQEGEYGISPLSTTYATGTRITIEGIGGLTMGHPTSARGTQFLTAPHTRAAAERSVFIHNTSQHIAYVSNNIDFRPHRDFAVVDFRGGNTIHPHVLGGPISNFRATASNGSTVYSIRGFSGTHHSVIDTTSAEGTFGPNDNFIRKIGVYPDGVSTLGDSGSALIRRASPTDRAVVGTRAGLGRVGTRIMGIYTNVLEY